MSEMSKSWWADALVVILGILILLCLLLPALQLTRHTSGRDHCLDNLKNLALALQNYHDTYKTFPAGAMHAGPRDNPRIGPSWWYGTLPFIEQSRFAPNIWETQRAGFKPAGVEFTYASMPDTERNPIKTWLRLGDRPFMRCPSSPSPERETEDGYIAFPSYVGIAGGCDIDPNSIDYEGCPDVPQPPKVPGTPHRYFNVSKGTGPNGSIVTSSGMLPVGEHIPYAKCTDGTSNVMMVGEQSDFLRDVDRSSPTKYHGDPGWNIQTDRNPGGWLTGTNAVEPVGQARLSAGPIVESSPGDWHIDLLFNVTTVRYPANLKHVMSSEPTKCLPGCAEIMGLNNPLQSPHPGVVLIAFVDGSVHMISSTADMSVLLQLAIRDDAMNVQLDK